MLQLWPLLSGARHLLFGTDMPYDSQFGLTFTQGNRQLHRADLAISEAEKRMIFEDNARDLLHLLP